MSRLYGIQGQDMGRGAAAAQRRSPAARAGLYLGPTVSCRYRASVKTVSRHSSRAGDDGTNYREKIIPRGLRCRRIGETRSAVVARNSENARQQAFSFDGPLDIDTGMERPYRWNDAVTPARVIETVWFRSRPGHDQTPPNPYFRKELSCPHERKHPVPRRAPRRAPLPRPAARPTNPCRRVARCWAPMPRRCCGRC